MTTGVASARFGMELSPRETQVMLLTCSGMTQREIAEEIGVSFETVNVYRDKAKLKLGARNICHAVWLYAQQTKGEQ